MHNFQSAILKFVAQKFYEPFVFLDCEDARAFRKHKFGQRAEPRPNLDDEVFRTDLCLVDDSSREIPIVQKVLAEAFDWRDADFPQSCGYFGQLHQDRQLRSRAAKN